MEGPHDDQTPGAGEPDPSADTEMFQAFVERGEDPPSVSNTRFRLLTLAAGLAVFVLLVWLLLR